MVSLPRLVTERSLASATWRNCVVPLKSATRSPLGRAEVDGYLPFGWYVPRWPRLVRSASRPEAGDDMAKYITGSCERISSSYRLFPASAARGERTVATA